MNAQADILSRIIARKHEEVAERSLRIRVDTLRQEASERDAPRGFIRHLRAKLTSGQPAVIAEVKKASPSKGLLRADFDPVAIAGSYQRGGAACLAVLTDADFFQGSEAYLLEVRRHVRLPILRKDFIVDPFQIHESRAIGADCVLLIVSALDDISLQTLYQQATELGMDVLVEVHDREELERALALSPQIIGINNRNLHNFETHLQTTLDLLDDIPDGVIVVSESGIRQSADVRLLRSRGVHAFLVGEACMRATDPGDSLGALFAH